MVLLLLIDVYITVGLFVSNVAARNKEMRTEILRSLANTFPNLLSIPISEDINEIVVGLPSAAIAKDGQAGVNSIDFDLPSSQGMKDGLTNLAAKVSKSSLGRLNAEDLLTEWTDLLHGAEVVQN